MKILITAKIRYDIAKGERVYLRHTEANVQYLYNLLWKPKYNII
jgi:hypothetical protein